MTKSGKTKRTHGAASSAVGKIVSIADLAHHLGLSTWTVSRAINGHPEVKEKTRQRILETMKELSFRPNPFARGLRGKGTGLVGVCFSGLGNPILNTKLFYLQEFLRRHQLRSIMEVSLRDRQNEMRVIEDFLNIHVEGVVLIHSGLTAKESKSLVKGMACIHVDPHEVHNSPSISLDRAKAMHLLLDHLLECGHRSFGLIGIGENEAWRWPALVKFAKQRGLDSAKIFIHLGAAPQAEDSIKEGRRMALTALKLHSRPTALICLDDRVAIGAIQALREEGLKVPDDMSVTGFDNLDLARQLHPTLTTIEQNPLRLMECAGEMLMEQIALSPNKRGRINERTVEPSLIIGESTGRVRED